MDPRLREDDGAKNWEPELSSHNCTTATRTTQCPTASRQDPLPLTTRRPPQHLVTPAKAGVYPHTRTRMIPACARMTEQELESLA
jgi:hypothetical protein